MTNIFVYILFIDFVFLMGFAFVSACIWFLVAFYSFCLFSKERETRCGVRQTGRLGESRRRWGMGTMFRICCMNFSIKKTQEFWSYISVSTFIYFF